MHMLNLPSKLTYMSRDLRMHHYYDRYSLYITVGQNDLTHQRLILCNLYFNYMAL